MYASNRQVGAKECYCSVAPHTKSTAGQRQGRHEHDLRIVAGKTLPHWCFRCRDLFSEVSKSILIKAVCAVSSAGRCAASPAIPVQCGVFTAFRRSCLRPVTKPALFCHNARVLTKVAYYELASVQAPCAPSVVAVIVQRRLKRVDQRL